MVLFLDGARPLKITQIM